MPGRSGPEVAAALSRRFPGLPVVYMSGYSSEDPGGPSRLPGGAVFVQKPFSPDGLLAQIRQALDGPTAAA
ncbi:MAG TPA: hypothetical protein VFM53_15430, partial [Anaeromyxobacteraceae bacterium]|nr:hypothetical protein [Anaeromyxobacteraceae bacterium]